MNDDLKSQLKFAVLQAIDSIGLEKFKETSFFGSTGQVWRDLKTDPPTSDRCVLIYPSISDVGHLYVVSNPTYARYTAAQVGYTHWCEIEPHPDEASAKLKVEEVRKADGELQEQFYTGFNRAVENIVDVLEELVPDRPAVVQAIKAKFVKNA